MERLSGILTAELADRNENYDENLIDEINQQIKPPRPISPDDVHIRAMYIVSDQINSQGGCFAQEELDQLARLLVDSPVMVGHQRDSLPLARNFRANKTEIDGRVWIKSYFYWMKNAVGAEDLKKNIDGGIYKECSVSFLYQLPECSICGEDIRQCRHIPFQEYETESGDREIAHFKYRHIEKVLETSLVFRGSVPDTRITDQLNGSEEGKKFPHQPIAATHVFKLSEMSSLDPKGSTYGQAMPDFGVAEDFVPSLSARALYVLPYQPGLMLRVTKSGQNISLESKGALPMKVHEYVRGVLSKIRLDSFKIDALLYAIRGRERLSGLGLMHTIESEQYLHRLRLKVCDIDNLNGEKLIDRRFGERMECLHNRFRKLCPDRVEVGKFREYSREAGKAHMAARQYAFYKFGVEVVTENADGSLSRYILNELQLIAAKITDMTGSDRAHMKCNLEISGSKLKLTGIRLHRVPGVQKGSVVLIRKRPSSEKGGQDGWLLADTFPDGYVPLTSPHISEPSHSSQELYVNLDDDLMHLVFPDNGRWQVVRVYRFSPRLFSEGRRFIADLIVQEPVPDGCTRGGGIGLDAVTRSGDWIHLHPKDSSSLFGDCTGLCLRPIMLGGRKRYLFYADEIIRLPEAV